MTAASLVPLLAAIPAPDPLPVPAPPGLLRGLLLLTFFLHLVPMNLLLGGALVALYNRLSGSAPGRELARDIVTALPVLVAATVTFGVAPLLFLQVLYGRLFFASAIAIGWWWLAVFPLVIAGYYGAYRAAHLARQKSARGRLAAVIVALAFLAVSFIYVNNMTLMLEPDRIAALHLAAPAGTSLNLGEPTLGPRWLHMVSGAFAVTGLALALYGVLRRDRSAASARLAVRQGIGLLLGGAVVGVATGILWLILLPADVMKALTMTDPVAATVMALGVLTGVATVVLAALAFRAEDPRRMLTWSFAALGVTLVLMIDARDQLRSLMLARAGFTTSSWVDTQVVPLLIFVVLLVAAVAIVGWMLRAIIWRASPDRPDDRTRRAAGTM